MQFSCPGKVFIIGEYACIEGGPAIISTVGPEFQLSIARGESPLPFDLNSPAGRFIETHRELFAEVLLNWRDPYDTPIGVGSSSAQFLLSLAAACHLQDVHLPTSEEALKKYWEIIGSSQGLRPSGVDVVAQWLGGPILVRNKPFFAEKLAPWTGDTTFILAFTGKKEKTHDHLKSLAQRGFPESFLDPLARLNTITSTAAEAWMRSDAAALGATLSSFQEELTRCGLAPESFSAHLRQIGKWPGVMGCKGAGAQGGDCALLLVNTDQIPEISRKIVERGWTPIHPNWTTHGVRRRE